MNLGIVIPCYNEEEVLPETAKRLTALIDRLVSRGKISLDSKMVFVDDGSTDRTWALIEELAARDRHVSGIKLSRNRGHQNALIAGLFTAEGDVLVSIDADLQDDIEAMEEMVDLYLAGTDIVYGVRKQRETDTAFKRISALGFYRLINWLGAESIYNHADYRLMSRRAIEALKDYREVNLYLRGIVPLIGFKSAIVHYDRSSRFAGVSKYPLRRIIALALDAITAFSVVPLRVITVTGFAIFAGSMMVTLWALWVRLFTNDALPGWTSIVLPMYFLGGLQILCFGVIGEYLGRVYSETKARPRFFIDRVAPDTAMRRTSAVVQPVAGTYG
jgi:glycosyltransferase involved in cell wall biosynthesis